MKHRCDTTLKVFDRQKNKIQINHNSDAYSKVRINLHILHCPITAGPILRGRPRRLLLLRQPAKVIDTERVLVGRE